MKMIMPEILDYQDVLTDELRKPARWIVAYVEPTMPWPVRVQKIVYLGQDFWIVPVTNDAYPAVAVQVDGESDAELRERILRFLSVLSWIENSGASLRFFGGGSRLIANSRPKNVGLTVCNRIDLRYLPKVTDPKAKLALALMREARALKHIAYSFLTFWRVLEVAVGKNRIQSWVAGAISKIVNRSAKEAIEQIQESGVKDLSKHLYVSGRCAIAHAESNPIIDPDQPKDSLRLAREIPLVEALAVLAIEEVLDVKTPSTVYQEHLYELVGFKRLLGDQCIKIILEKGDIPDGIQINLPIIDIGLMDKQPIPAFCKLKPFRIDCKNGIVSLAFARFDGRLRVQFALNFPDERLEFDVTNAVFGPLDDGSPDWAEIKADSLEFLRLFFLNGCLTVTDSETGELIARKDEFIPVNVNVDPKEFDVEIGKWREVAEQRRSSGECNAVILQGVK